MKKIIFLIAITLFLTGCSVEYNVTIDEVIQESVSINENIDWNAPAFIDEQGASETNEKIEGLEYYDIENNGFSTTYKYDFTFNNYSRSRAINTCLKSVSLSEINNEYLLNTSGYFSCMDYYTEIEDIKINLTFGDNYIITANNADVVNNNILTWNINRNNYTDKYIQVRFKDKEAEQEEEPIIDEPIDDEEEKENTGSWIIATVAVLAFIGLISFLFYFKIKNSQRG